MKHKYNAWRFLDANANDNGGGSTAIITKAIDDSFNKFKGELDNTKTSLSKSIDDSKDELKKDINESVTLATEAKNLAKGVEVKLDEFDKKFATSSFAKGDNAGNSFEAKLKSEIDKNTDTIAKFVRGERKSFALEITGMDQKAVGAFSVTNLTGSSTWGAQRRPDIVMNQNTMTHVRSLLPVTPAGPGTDYYFMRENGVGEGSIAPTSETTAAAAATTQATGLKPQFDLDLIESSVKFETIAGWMLLSKRAMNNIQGLTGFLQRRVPEKLMDVEDQQILYGTGTSPQIKGILASGNYVAGSAAGSTVLSDKIINDISLFEDTYKRIANGIVMRPSDYWGFFKQKASGSGEYDLPQGFVFVNGVLYAMGIPVAKTTALTANDYVVGDFQNGAELLIQESIRLEFFEQDSTNVRTNQVTLRVEETIALPVYGPDYFIKGSSALS